MLIKPLFSRHVLLLPQQMTLKWSELLLLLLLVLVWPRWLLQPELALPGQLIQHRRGLHHVVAPGAQGSQSFVGLDLFCVKAN